MSEKTYSIPKKCFDMEYATQWKKEVEYLYTVGIKPTFTKRDKEYGVITYKYKKTAKLFGALAAFYQSIEDEKGFEEMTNLFNNKSVLVFNVSNEQAETIAALMSCSEDKIFNPENIMEFFNTTKQVCESDA